ncbi:hypothetical protein DERP_011354 [Dermatophagoides pteronyssinus]|uniref:Uncharacterized protein n=1 Tax=Dermatophagoides pteronyssinus TaxID=6956 RepID=A0ABQ8J7C4_DERPT|nr:hypothetical protein DERP_011354 [Dermatophagoides pteronyssinus]
MKSYDDEDDGGRKHIKSNMVECFELIMQSLYKHHCVIIKKTRKKFYNAFGSNESYFHACLDADDVNGNPVKS